MGSFVAAQDWIEVRISSTVDAGEMLGMLNDPDVTGAWEEDGIVRLYWPAGRWNSDTLAQLKEVIGRLNRVSGESRAGAAIAIDRLPDRDWNEAWAKSVKPLRIGRRLVIRPSWEPVALGPQDIELILDPKQAFGTGHHATTRLLLEWLEDLIRGGEKVLDVGTGSGILAMAAIRLGAASALGLDHDPVALECAQDYASLNRFGPELTLRLATAGELTKDTRQTFDLVLANLDRQTILDSVDFFAPFLRSGARLLLCGVLLEDRAAIADAFGTIGGVLRSERNRDGWLALEVLLPESCDS